MGLVIYLTEILLKICAGGPSEDSPNFNDFRGFINGNEC